jgi:hypothetical protein
VGSDEKRLGRTIVRINTIESTSPLATSETVDEACLPPALVPSEPEAPDAAYERAEVRDRVRAAIALLPARERKVIGLYYYGDVTMKQIGAEIGVNESRVSQLHARAIKRLRQVLGPDMAPADAMSALRSAVLAFHQRPVMAKAELPSERTVAGAETKTPAVVVSYKRQAARSRASTHASSADGRRFDKFGPEGRHRARNRDVLRMSQLAGFGVYGAVRRGSLERPSGDRRA